jgi:high-affinity Fe2+/Pb2+ permease
LATPADLPDTEDCIMAQDFVRQGQPASDHLHPLVYKGIVALAVWFVASAWVCFGTTGGYAAYSVVVVAGFFIIVIAIPLLLWITWRRHRVVDSATAAAEMEQSESFRDWSSRIFVARHSQLSGREATVQALLPIAAVAIGMMSIGAVFWIVESSVT